MVPPTNHLANGGFDQSRTWSHFRPQSSRSAASAQNASRSASARAYASSVTLAFGGQVGRGLEAPVLVHQVRQGLLGQGSLLGRGRCWVRC